MNQAPKQASRKTAAILFKSARTAKIPVVKMMISNNILQRAVNRHIGFVVDSIIERGDNLRDVIAVNLSYDTIPGIKTRTIWTVRNN